ncbi:hypothetical protein MJC1_04145 [Methylocystis sp. MJC1]|jgi:hypothetical protein|nr:hypothetical protein MJC1_04145 [Methylocystis sp. MJC1]
MTKRPFPTWADHSDWLVQVGERLFVVHTDLAADACRLSIIKPPGPQAEENCSHDEENYSHHEFHAPAADLGASL